jgi:hypothetical protein
MKLSTNIMIVDTIQINMAAMRHLNAIYGTMFYLTSAATIR